MEYLRSYQDQISPRDPWKSKQLKSKKNLTSEHIYRSKFKEEKSQKTTFTSLKYIYLSNQQSLPIYYLFTHQEKFGICKHLFIKCRVQCLPHCHLHPVVRWDILIIKSLLNLSFTRLMIIIILIPKMGQEDKPYSRIHSS